MPPKNAPKQKPRSSCIVCRMNIFANPVPCNGTSIKRAFFLSLLNQQYPLMFSTAFNQFNTSISFLKFLKNLEVIDNSFNLY